MHAPTTATNSTTAVPKSETPQTLLCLYNANPLYVVLMMLLLVVLDGFSTSTSTTAADDGSR